MHIKKVFPLAKKKHFNFVQKLMVFLFTLKNHEMYIYIYISSGKGSTPPASYTFLPFNLGIRLYNQLKCNRNVAIFCILKFTRRRKSQNRFPKNYLSQKWFSRTTFTVVTTAGRRICIFLTWAKSSKMHEWISIQKMLHFWGNLLFSTRFR